MKAGWVAAFGALVAAGALVGCGDTEAAVPSAGGGGGILTGASSTGTGGAGATGATAQTSATTGASTTSAATGGSGGEAPFVCAGKASASGTPLVTLSSGGVLRTSLLHVPPHYDPAKGTMLVVNFHGFSSDAPQEALLTEMSAAADARGFLVAYPYGLFSSWNAGQCCGTAWTNSVDDVGFVRDLLDKLEEDYCIDPKRVFATGMSNGGFMSHRLGCEMADRFAAVGPVAGALGIPAEQCTPPRAVPVIHFHGTADPLVPYDGGVPLVLWDTGGMLDFPSVDETLAVWRAVDGCGQAEEVVYQNGDSTCVHWPGCADGSDVVRCVAEGAGHTWPGGLALPGTSMDINATVAMLDFFDAHPMP